MFEFGRELRRWFGGETSPGPFQDGLTGGDGALLELLELDMLHAEARAADVAAGRISAKDRPARQLEAACVWREIARRTGDAAALRKAASHAEQAAAGVGRESRPRRWAAARCEQALAAMAGAALYGDEGLNAAADVALAEAQKAAGPALPGAMALAARAAIEARRIMTSGDREACLRAAGRFDAPIRALDGHARRGAVAAKLIAIGARVDRAELLSACGARLKDTLLLRMALDGLTVAGQDIDPAFEPLTWARVAIAHGQARSALGELDGDVGEISEAVTGLVSVLEQISRDHSPLDWAQAQLAVAEALQMLGEAGDAARAFDQALSCYDRALLVLAEQPMLPLRAAAAHSRVVCLVRRAEQTCDLESLAEAEASLRVELTLADPVKDPVAWAVRQLSFAQICEARAAITRRDVGSDTAVGIALSAALDVFAEHGLRGLSDTAARGLERLRVRAEQKS
jgi:tetratricopeptide (TPR) repeat protein